jgi:perosamine synthetase
MSIPFFSIDLDLKDIFSLTKNIIFPFNKQKSELKIQKILERRFPNKSVVILPSARLGFYLSLKKYFKENDEIIFSSMSFPLYVKIANQLKLKVRLVDVNEKNLNIDLKKLNESITPLTKGIVATHLFGYPCEINQIKDIAKKNNIVLIEDCAQSFGTYSNEIETGNFGDVGIFSCSLIKIPTTLGGGILITSNKELVKFIYSWKKENLSKSIKKEFLLILKNIISVANSFPFLYSILSSKVLFFLNRFNPRVYRKIIYSGMGLKKGVFDPRERSDLSKYQLEFGISQLNKLDKMQEKRTQNSIYLKNKLAGLKNVSFLDYDEQIKWNYQYFIIKINSNYSEFNKKIFKRGVHAMEENVWNCLDYNYSIINDGDNFNRTIENNQKILRIQNSSYLTKKNLDKIISTIIESAND